MPQNNNFNSNRKNPVVLLSPLDWGLGHTTRCIPIIHELVHQQCKVIIACNPIQKALLEQEFPQLDYVDLEGYGMRYGKTKWGTIFRLFLQAPKILSAVKNEKIRLDILLQQHTVDIIISDNRFGFYSAQAHSIFITHQLYVKTGLGWLADRLIQRLNYKKINQFNTCWVPDFKGAQSLAGQLSNPAKMPELPVHYLGGLSRLQSCAEPTTPDIDLLILLSGPEPQRTLFEEQLLVETRDYPGRVVIVRGLPQKESTVETRNNVTLLNHAPAEQINKLLCSAKLVISRSGYTTVMDLLKLRKKSILVPTPGQAEQEYLALHLHQQQLAYTISQAQFSLKPVLRWAEKFNYKLPVLDMEGYKEVVQTSLKAVNS